MRRTTSPLLLFLLGLSLLVWVLPAFSQSDMVVVNRDPFPKAQRPAAKFEHDAHNEKAKLEDCGACHHGETDGKMDPANTSEGTPCADCHAANPAADPKLQHKTPLRRAYHLQCVGCHEKTGKGPLACGQCHAPTAQE
ncbi:acidic tetraheme cytochrome c3 TmcA [Megalodesulfovibrio gigas]|uniref:Putative cytochrome c class III n=1 Tax=Megalodesulfovibrio gigas (strain ATCC 19364 / DSM 1382 / NCIMB 9332 / VKM B-1759) TaxID=1121448 RepID=T2GA91_MEGG1|nr:cytochrome c3 family protein [Megalodesulfovibrio gigas]AGW13515.1 putative cytochrome c class III [Megalodesulfovibrio gigas DSM 1382 = ATCC 19364]